jgi:hypothetical protein
MARAPERVRDFYATLLPTLGSSVRTELDGLAAALASDGHEGPLEF